MRKALNLPVIERRKMAREIADALLASIRAAALAPGDQLPPERELAQQLQVSRASLREALSMLEARGVTVSQKGVGTFIAGPASTVASADVIRALLHIGSAGQLIEASAFIDMGAAMLAAERRTEDDLAILRQDLASIEHWAATDPSRYLDPDLDFHLHVAHASRNPILIAQVAAVVEWFRGETFSAYRQQRPREALAPATEVRIHRAIYEAIAARAPKDALLAALEHTRITSAFYAEFAADVQTGRAV